MFKATRVYTYTFYAAIFAAQVCLVSPAQIVSSIAIFGCLLTFVIYQTTIAVTNNSSDSPSTGLAPALLLLGYIALQSVPLPPSILPYMSTASSNIFAETAWVVDPEYWLPVSIDTKATIQGFFTFSAFLAVFLLTNQLLTDQLRMYKSLNCICWITFLSAVTYLAGVVAQGTEFLNKTYDYRVTEIVMGYLMPLKDVSIVIIVVFAPLVYSAHKIKALKAVNVKPGTPLGFRNFAFLVLIVCAIVLSGSLLICSAMVVSVLSWWSIFAIKRAGGWYATQLAVLILFCFFVGLYLNTSGLNTYAIWNWETVPAINPIISQDSSEALSWRELSFAGTGVDTFETAQQFFSYDKFTINPQPSRLWQVIVEFGLAGFLIILWLYYSLLYKTFFHWTKRHNKAAIYLYAGAFASLQGYLLIATAAPYSSYRTPMLLLAIVLSIMVSVAKSSHRGGQENSGAFSMVKTVWVGLLLLLSCSVFWGNERYAEKVYPDTWRQEESADNDVATSMNSEIEKAEFALTLAPLSHRNRLKTIDMYLANSSHSQALAHSIAMLKLRPLSGEGLLVSGTVLDYAENDDGADRLMEAALKTKPESHNRHVERINLLLVQGMQKQAIKYAYYALSLHPGKTGECLALLDLYDIPEDDKRLVVPLRSSAYWAYAKIQSEQGNQELASIYYTNAARLASREVQPNPEIFLSAIAFLVQDGQQEAALNIALKGQEVFPLEAEFAYLAGQIYEQIGITYRALEEYRKASLLDPGNQLVQRSLSALRTR